jgi:formylglycine-generating enzyme required for sulfatase activity
MNQSRVATGAWLLATVAHAVAYNAPVHARPADHRAGPAIEAHIADLKARSAAIAAVARARLDALSPEARRAAAPEAWRVPGAIASFRDCSGCPQMVVVPAGEFTMGSSSSDLAGATRHRVTIAAPFAVSKFEITFDQWDMCLREGGCGGYRPSDQGWGRGDRPVIDVSWENAHAYVDWLGRKTGKRYRLLSESEWEYAARAGTTTAFPVGDRLSPREANYDGSSDGSGPSGMNRQRTLPVGRFAPNRFGLYDMLGNVTEWVEDCWHDDFTAASPTDGSAWIEAGCRGGVLRGGSWEDSESELRSAARTGEFKDRSSYADGIRVARDL